jgi:hypothetical protein
MALQKLTVCGFYKVVCCNKMLILSVSQHTTVNTALAGVFALWLNTSYSIHPCTVSLLVTVSELMASNIIQYWHTTLIGKHSNK